MAEIKSQGLRNLLINYIGFAVGGVNYILLLPLYFATYEIGLIRLLISLANVWVSLAKMGTNVTFVRFFKHFETEDRSHRGFVHLMYVFGGLGMAMLTVLYVIFEDVIHQYFVAKSPLFADEYYWTLVPFSLLMLLFSMLESQASAIQRTVLSNFLREVALRVVFLASIMLFVGQWLGLRSFIWIQVLAYGAISVIMVFDLSLSKRFSWRAAFHSLKPTERGQLARYSLLMTLTTGVQQLITNLDSAMLGAMAGLEDVGIYAVYLSIALLVVLPERSLIRIMFPVANEALLKNDWARVKELYVKSALIQMVAGLWIFAGIWLNEHNLYYFLKGAEYRDGFVVFILLGANYLINMAFGINSYIILGTSKYRVETWLNLALLGLTVVFNYVLIQRYGAAGAAGATLLSITLINFLRWAYILRQFKISPFTWRHPAVMGWAALGFWMMTWVPVAPWPLMDIMLRSSAFTTFYFGGILLMRISPDINQLAFQLLKRLKKK